MSNARLLALRYLLTIVPGLVVGASPAGAAQVDIHGPMGSRAFGTAVTVLPNGNIVVTDPYYTDGTTPNLGAVYLLDPSGNRIATLTGSNADDYVGGYGVTAVGVGNFVVSSADWNNGSAAHAGAVTWVNGATGLNGAVTTGNSLVGTHAGDYVGSGGVTALSNGNYVVSSSTWTGGLQNGSIGAATWGNGATGVKGAVSDGNSLVGSYWSDCVGYGITALSNGHYVVFTPAWTNESSPPVQNVGAVTWGNGKTGTVGRVSAGNSLIGSTANDSVGNSGVVALSNGSYVVASPYWNNAGLAHAGAATWADGTKVTADVVSASNSLVGSYASDSVGDHITALYNGNYVVASSGWSNGTAYSNYGAVTWGDGAVGTVGAVSIGNSLVGNTVGDYVGYDVVALRNGNYVVVSPFWSNGTAHNIIGAATWVDGTRATVDIVSAANSLIGMTSDDEVGKGGVTALSDGNFVVASPKWNNGTPGSNVGAVTWVKGSHVTAGTVSPANSVIGTTKGDQVGSSGAAPLSNGNFAIASPYWNNGMVGSHFGAVTWINGVTGIAGTVSASKSVIGADSYDQIGVGGIVALSDGNYVVWSPYYNSGLNSDAGAITLADGHFRTNGVIAPWNSVIGAAYGGGVLMVYAYDALRHQLAVGRPSDNTISLLTPDQIFAGDFDP